MNSGFIDYSPTLNDYWRAIILFGRNVASYKFALGKTLLEFAEQAKDAISLEDLAVPFSRHLCEHLKGCDKQARSGSSRFLDSCRAFNRDEVSEDELVSVTTKRGFVNVVDAFHVVQNEEIDVRFFVDERRSATRGIRLTDELMKLAEGSQALSFPEEIEARWRLVETAWELSLPRSSITVDYDGATSQLVPSSNRRKSITGCRQALNGYQKGHCFYCFAEISIEAGTEGLGEVDHFFPHTLTKYGLGQYVDGIWNLVLACHDCNRRKSDQLPTIEHLTRLGKRNEFFVTSHHPLRETVIFQTGTDEEQRRQFLQNAYREARPLRVQTWNCEPRNAPVF